MAVARTLHRLALESALRAKLQQEVGRLRGEGKEEDAAAEKEARQQRVVGLRHAALKRFLHPELGRGWYSWACYACEAAYRKRLVAAAVGRWRTPALAACLVHWRDDWEAEERSRRHTASVHHAARQARRRMK